MFIMCLFLGQNCVYQLPEPLLRGHRGRNEGDLHQQPHVEALWELSGRHMQGNGSRFGDFSQPQWIV